jgi:hypothetical protein
MVKKREKLATLLKAKFVGEVPDVGAGMFGMARLAHIVHRRLLPVDHDPKQTRHGNDCAEDPTGGTGSQNPPFKL